MIYIYIQESTSALGGGSREEGMDQQLINRSVRFEMLARLVEEVFNSMAGEGRRSLPHGGKLFLNHPVMVLVVIVMAP